ncbi:hypothetical protein H257_10699 [Aphanomyces astaci]|uniref:Uncharacterized protein n=1 Tax=Aphanomyces astaci TaxID=112090 RepID=W4G875_APHAT|nr:hypothetical protein H257_10699 [Aphanomyces astaci]ETV75133.1 hypothetical protein H257_10699 [Aphanomyces astaci]|eukprot:XP_009835637.1 hypothetical protein H257_10699 [Aphanomyces astaci]
MWARLKKYIDEHIYPVVVQMAQARGHHIVYAAPGFSELQPIELIWANVKGTVGRAYTNRHNISRCIQAPRQCILSPGLRDHQGHDRELETKLIALEKALRQAEGAAASIVSDVPIRRFTSKRHIVKVMFLTAVARVRYDARKKAMWNGKIGMWPFVSMVPAQRKSKNRERGTMVTTPLTVTKPIYRQFLVDHVSIKLLWPGRRTCRFTSNKTTHGLMFKLMTPSWLLLVGQTIVTTIDELVSAATGAFNDLDGRVLDKTFMVLQKVLEESLKIGGDNAYKLPHLHKDKLARQGPQNPQLACDPEVMSVIDEMNSRKEFERRVDNLSGVLASCAIEGTINMSNIDNLCAMARDIDLVDNDEE